MVAEHRMSERHACALVGLSRDTYLYCPSCSGEYETQGAGDKFRLVATGKKGLPADLEPKVDQDVIDDVVRTTARSLLAY